MPRYSRVIKFLIPLLMCLVLGITVGCIPFSSGYLTSFSQAVGNSNGGKWSYDGRWFAASVNTTYEDTLQLLSPTWQIVSTLNLPCDLGGEGRDFAWLPDGRLSCFSQTESAALRLVEIGSNGRVGKINTIRLPLTQGVITLDFQWNPHHPWLATIASSSPGSDTNSLYLTDIHGQSLTTPIIVDADNLAWSPDGKTLEVTERQSGVAILLSVQPTNDGKVTVKEVRRMAEGVSDIADVAWSPSGRWLLCRHASYDSEDYLFLLATDGSGKQVKLTSSNTDGQLDFPAWSPNGKQLIVVSIALANNQLMSLDIVKLLKDKGVSP